MQQPTSCPMGSCLWRVTMAVVVMATSGAAELPSGAEKKLPPLAKVQSTVVAHLKSLPDYQKGDIISSSDVKPIFGKLALMGWAVPDQAEILQMMLSDNHFLVKELRTPGGKRFMRKVSQDPTVYDRLDRVSQHKRGPATIRQLASLPDGERFTKAKSGPGKPTMSDLVLIYDRGSVASRGIKDYDQPTGLIYTGREFLKRLTQSYEMSRLTK